ncbi:hypothetical protein [Lachnotalea glycerini]|uniref:Uncharacterized protein n=1 Tax=Lachnotalea glycerini TaxID=1763509 RepID=A0A371JBW9_9FIRM|nr:hypothetical protein [Lachnotalea glycerini]RDY30177.1 hypothetical protein CG710_016200 [Lachnotalea glycerini]
MKRMRCFRTLLVTLVFSLSLMSISTYAASSTIEAVRTSKSTKTVKTNEKMYLVLNGKESGYSNSIQFDFRSLPDNAIVTNVEIVASVIKSTYIPGVTGVIQAKKIVITNPQSITNEVSWGSMNETTTHTFDDMNASGIWYVSFYGTNILYTNTDFAAISYSPVTMKITYSLE